MGVPPEPPDPNVFVPPTVDDVGALLRARTQDDHDDEIGTFTADTRPTDVQVQKIIDQAVSVVFTRTGAMDTPPLDCPTAPSLRTNAASCASMLAVMLVELSYFPEQVRSDRSAFEDYRDLWNTLMDSLVDAAAECRGGEVVPDEKGEGYRPGPSWGFPVDAGGLVGWNTQW
jgi:hypothetical protein